MLRVIGDSWDAVEVVWSFAVPDIGRGFVAYQVPTEDGSGYRNPIRLGDRYLFARARVGEMRTQELAPEAWEVADRIGAGVVSLIEAIRGFGKG